MTTWRIELSYSGMAGFATEETASLLSIAIENAIYYAHACGWPETPTKKRAIELKNEQKEKQHGK